MILVGQMMWDLIEKPDTSRAAQVISIVSTGFVAISIVGMTVATMPSLQYEVSPDYQIFQSNSSCFKDANGNLVENPILAIIETIAIAWFTLEYLIR